MGHPMPGAAAAPALSPDDEAELVRAAQASPARFKPLYERWVTPVYKYLLARTRDPLEAEDLTSQVFLTACEQLPRYDHRGRFAAWLFTIARNESRDYYRAASRRVRSDDVEARGVDPDLLGHVIRADETQRLERAIGALPEEERELIRLRFTAGLTHAEIGGLLGKREDAVRKQLARLLARLEAQMEDDHD
jgi:RNA polymerase sigma-70 factor, ECF subfamily